jgi:hypothetical protein
MLKPLLELISVSIRKKCLPINIKKSVVKLDILNKSQFGFRKNKSIKHAIGTTIEI